MPDETLLDFAEAASSPAGARVFELIATRLVRAACDGLQDLRVCEVSGAEVMERLERLRIKVTVALPMSLVLECGRRVALVDTPTGLLVRKCLVRGTQSLDLEEVGTLTQAGRRRRYNPDAVDGSSGEQRKENASLHWETLLEQVTRTRDAATASVTTGLAMLLSGSFNRVPSDADDMARGRIKTARARQDVAVAFEEHDIAPAQIELVAMPSDTWDDEILLTELFSLGSLSDQERQVLEFGLQDRPQKDIAAEMSITQGRVSQLRRNALAKIRQAFPSTQPER